MTSVGDTWEVHDAAATRKQAPATITVTKTGLYLTRAATLMLPKATRFVVISKDGLHFRLRILRCAKNTLHARTFRKLHGDRARVTDTTILSWLGNRVPGCSRFVAHPATKGNGIEIDFSRPLAKKCRGDGP